MVCLSIVPLVIYYRVDEERGNYGHVDQGVIGVGKGSKADNVGETEI